jgi:uncharacterized protein YjiS (DUF1127 family)
MHTILEPRPLELPFSGSRPPSLGIGFRLCAALRRAAEAVLAWQDRRAQRLALGNLEDRLLKDIGLTRTQAAAEVRRSLWLA